MTMNWELADMVWPTVYLLLAGAALFAVWMVLLRVRNPRGQRWREIGLIALFCLVAAGLVLTAGTVVEHLPLTARLGLVGVVLAGYAVYQRRRPK